MNQQMMNNMQQGMNPVMQQMMQQQMMQQQMMQQQMMQAQQQAMNQQAMNQQMQSMLSQVGNNSGAQPTASVPTGPTSTGQSSGSGICVIFRASGTAGPQGAPIMIQCMPDDRVSDVINKYRIKANDNDTSKKFIFNAKNLNASLTLSEAGITNNANIFVVTTKGVKGAFWILIW